MMGVADRERAALPKKQAETDVSTQEFLDVLKEIRDRQDALAEHMDSLRNHQGVQTDKLAEHAREYQEIIDALAQSEAARAKANEAAATTQKQLIEVVRKLLDTVDKYEQNMKAFLSERERKLDEAVNHARGLGPDIAAGFGRLIQQAATPMKQRLMQTAIVAGSSIVGGALVFLLGFVIFQGAFHTQSPVNTSTPPAAAAHHTTSKSK